VRRSLAVKLTLLPMLASAAAAAQPAPSDEPPLQPPGATEPMLAPPGLTPAIDECSVDPDDPRCPLLDECQTDPGDPPCPPEEESPEAEGYGGYAHGIFGGPIHGRHHRHHYHHYQGVFRGGFGHYFWSSGS
jgi:hypothetical protein